MDVSGVHFTVQGQEYDDDEGYVDDLGGDGDDEAYY